MVHVHKGLSDQDQAYGYLNAYVDGQLSDDDQSKVDDSLKNLGLDKISEQYADYKGKLQGAFSDHLVSEDQRQKLLSIGSTIGTRLQTEITESKKLRFYEVKVLIRRYAILAGVLAALAFVAVKIWLPHTYEKFKPLDYLGWEAQAFEEDPEGRLDFPSQNIEEVTAFLTAYPNLRFKPVVLAPMNDNVNIVGATVIDYEPTKVAVVMYELKDSEDALMHFSYRGALEDLPPTQAGSLSGFAYQAYSSEYYNLVAWESSGEVTSFLVGRLGAEKLAELARVGSGR